MRGILGTPSFLVIIAQGILGTTPWLALVFATLYLQLLGFSDLQASVLVAIFLASNAVGEGRGVHQAPESAMLVGSAFLLLGTLMWRRCLRSPPTNEIPAGGLLGGLLGDWAARRWPDHGRIAVCQLSVSLGVPLSALIFKVQVASLSLQLADVLESCVR